MAVHLAKGVRDILPATMRHRLEVIGRVREVFERFGFDPLDTPAIERIETLTGKYGDEGDKLLFRILARGEAGQRGEVDLALRYDLTVPLARVVAMNADLRLPFKRWQVAPVWRADRPQRGRFREFFQCDCDIVGTTSPLADAECLAVFSASLQALGFADYRLRLNDRRILRALARAAGAGPELELTVLIVVDKLDKIGREGVTRELQELGLAPEGIAALWRILDIPAGGAEALEALDAVLDDHGREGVATLREVLPLAHAMGVPSERLVVDPTLARGLDYYTGPVFEGALPGFSGSVGGGGRYDGLVGMFSGRDIPCVGVSLGLERLLLLLEERGEAQAGQATAEVLVTVHDADTRAWSIEIARIFREAGIRTELYLDDRKLKPQLKHADARGYRFVAFAGPGEQQAGQVRLKDMQSGVQVDCTPAEAARRIQVG
ncbi:MAG: histidine--tRNA ligase [Alphaproteobacteria bacterium]|nr:histidine--tRNA ligase [Alphaproteobacteria bacterium]